MPLATALTFTKLLDTVPASDSSGAAGIIVTIIYLAIAVFYIAAGWRIFTKAGRPGWAILIPIYNTIVLLRITGHSGWTILLFFIPIVDFIFLIILLNDLSKAFGHGVGFMLGLLFLTPIFYPILAFGGSKYIGKPA
jgi:Family of unknown function (DUF5684)